MNDFRNDAPPIIAVANHMPPYLQRLQSTQVKGRLSFNIVAAANFLCMAGPLDEAKRLMIQWYFI